MQYWNKCIAFINLYVQSFHFFCMMFVFICLNRFVLVFNVIIIYCIKQMNVEIRQVNCWIECVGPETVSCLYRTCHLLTVCGALFKHIFTSKIQWTAVQMTLQTSRRIHWLTRARSSLCALSACSLLSSWWAVQMCCHASRQFLLSSGVGYRRPRCYCGPVCQIHLLWCWWPLKRADEASAHSELASAGSCSDALLLKLICSFRLPSSLPAALTIKWWYGNEDGECMCSVCNCSGVCVVDVLLIINWSSRVEGFILPVLQVKQKNLVINQKNVRTYSTHQLLVFKTSLASYL